MPALCLPGHQDFGNMFLRTSCWRGVGRRLFSSASSSFQRIGFIGLGNMGSHMANNLMKAGYQLIVHDINAATVKVLLERGALAATSPMEVASLAEAVITMLPSAVSVAEVYLGSQGLLSTQDGVRPSLMIDASTVDPQTCHQIASVAKQCSLSGSSRRIGGWNHPLMLDSPVSGGVPGAQAGTLTFMVLLIILKFAKRVIGIDFRFSNISKLFLLQVGGIEDGCMAAKPLFDCMGKNVLYCGGSGNGAAAKICNNLALAVSMAGISEALALGQQLGICAHTLSKIFNTSTARCWSSDTYNPVPGVMEGVPASSDYNGGFSCHLMKKDLGLAVAAAENTGASTLLSKQVYNMYSKLCEDGKGSKDFSSIFKFTYMGSSEELVDSGTTSSSHKS